MSELVVPAWAWCLMAVVMVAMIATDLFAHRGARAESRRAALVWTATWIAAALAFGAFVWLHFGADAGEQFFAAYVLEKSLSVDNLFVFLVVFAALRIPSAEQRRILTWGIAGALVTRGLFIAGGAALLHAWHPLTYVLGAALVITAAKTMRAPASHDGAPPRALTWLSRRLPPFFAAMIAIELVDLLFALDSIPAALAITDEPFLVYSSNVFALLGLRALYVALAGALAELRYLRFGLAAVLAFAGAKMLASAWWHVPPALSVAVIVAFIGASIAASLARRPSHDGRTRSHLAAIEGGAHDRGG
jgi:tellurite resistance protein TerC